MRSSGSLATLSRRRSLNSALKNFLRQIPFRGIGNQRHYALPCSKAFGDFNRGIQVCSRTRASEYAFAGSQFFHHAKGLLIGDHHHFVAKRTVKISRDKTVADAFHFVRTWLSSTQNRALGLH